MWWTFLYMISIASRSWEFTLLIRNTAQAMSINVNSVQFNAADNAYLLTNIYRGSSITGVTVVVSRQNTILSYVHDETTYNYSLVLWTSSAIVPLVLGSQIVFQGFEQCAFNGYPWHWEVHLIKFQTICSVASCSSRPFDHVPDCRLRSVTFFFARVEINLPGRTHNVSFYGTRIKACTSSQVHFQLVLHINSHENEVCGLRHWIQSLHLSM